jgi:FemAB-related protein (PEP-CTERM system-associated)
MSVSARLARPVDDPEWNAFVEAHPLGTPFHLTAWRDCIEATFGYKPRLILAEGQGRLRGVLPLYLVSSPLAGRLLLSSPFAVYGGVLAEDEQAVQALKAAMEDLAREEGVQYVELRNAWESQCLGYERVRRYVTFTHELKGTEEELLYTIPKKTRNLVRKSLKCNLTACRTEDLEPFYRLYFTNLRRLGTPAFPRHYFPRILRAFGSSVYVLEIRHEARPVAAMLTFEHKGAIMPYYGASDRDAHHLAPNNYLYWELMRSGLERGMRVLDFGRSKKMDDGVFFFKSQWGSQMRELPYEILLVKRRSLPNLSPANPKFSPVIAMWKRLPLWLTNRLGPLLIKWVP